ncbi:OmpA family protein [Methylobacter sp. YRD-M1]|uniref:OmpA family protein n=1 Tax=Methylobacter sp. YRD-M1 TaxID=2911520 RepID=UPI00227D5656|nr:OmpA family protein [Methylobacter sp. YRD-M1]WAK01490.1 OmpA family protein [Methylobacter sp. YRD-M1]
MSTRKWNAAAVYCKAGILIGAVLMLAGCATEPHRGLEEAKQNLNRAKQDPKIANNAQVALYDAEQTINRAHEAWEEDEDEEYVDHLVYMANQELKIAEANAQEKMSNDEFERLSESSKQMQLEARTRELDELKAQQIERGLLVTLGDLQFQTGKARLDPSASHNLYQLASYLKENPNRKIVIEGHTDSVGSSHSNQLLSERRAHAVANFLISNGVNSSRITDIGYGEDHPVDTNSTAAGRRHNRRVEVIIMNEGEEPRMRY